MLFWPSGTLMIFMLFLLNLFQVLLSAFHFEALCQFYSFLGYFMHLHFELSDSFLRSYYSPGAFILWDFNLSYNVFQFWHFCFHFSHFRAYIPCVLLVVHSIISLTVLNTLDIFPLKVFFKEVIDIITKIQYKGL